ncbi:MAG: hypothetical protein PVF05_03205 [Gemmatimonadales bacterium]
MEASGSSRSGNVSGRWLRRGAGALIAFSAGWLVRPASSGEVPPDPRVTGLGGVFFKSADPGGLRSWYRDHLGIEFGDWGGFAFLWREQDRLDEIGYTIWGPFPDTTRYFSPSELPYMVNFRVADLESLLQVLRDEDVEIVGELERHPNGSFAWILDPEGRKIELWEPVPSDEDPYLRLAR